MGLTMAKKQTKARKVLQKPPILGWKTIDSDEIELRRWRGRAEIARIEALEPKLGRYGTFRARSSGGGLYEVEIRDLKDRTNSCGCPDHRVNSLGTCKHIEGVLFALRKRLGARALFRRERGSHPSWGLGPFAPAQHGLHALDHRSPARGHPDLGEIRRAVEHAVGQRLLGRKEMQDRMLDRIFGDEIDDRYGALLTLAPCPGDALLELGGIPPAARRS